MNPGFESLHIEPPYIKKLLAMGIDQPTSIQQQAIPLMLSGRDVIAQSQTGTGKTLAYVLPLLHKIDPREKRLQALILVPTRELGMQIMRELDRLTQDTGIVAQALIGGAAIQRQIDKLKLHPHLAVGTPGRILELLKLRKLSVHHVRSVVVDEVDQVFDLGAMNEVEAVLKSMMRDRQICFFSATMPESVGAVADRWMREPETVRVNPGQRTSETLEHLYFVCEERDKLDTLRRLVRLYNPPSAIVFVNEADQIGEVVSKLQHVGLSVEALYADAGKVERARTMSAFREGRFQLLLATDVAARGLDIPGVTHVINLDPPIDADHYVHRAGRTGRMGRNGTDISIMTPKEEFIIGKFEKALGLAIERKAMYAGKVVDPAKPRGPAAPKRAGTAARVSGFAPDTRETPSRRGASAAAAGRAPAGPAAPGKSSPPSKKAEKAAKERDRKNKGAPRWLKQKQTKPET